MSKVNLMMGKDKLDDFDTYELPEGFHFEFYQSGDMEYWVNIEVSALEFPNVEAAVSRFSSEFENLDQLLSERCLFVVSEHNIKVGTVMAWFGDRRGHEEGRIHWVSILPEYQGMKLAKPMLSKALDIISTNYNTAFLTTTNLNIKAINMYLDFGFKPEIRNDEEFVVWKDIGRKLKRNL